MTLRRAWFVAGLALATASCFAGPARATDASSASEPACELHLWGVGYPNRPPARPPRPNAFVKVVTPPSDPNDPTSLAYLSNTARRAAAFSDETLRKLLPDAASVTIVRHQDVIDLDRHPIDKIAAPLVASSAACYADLIVANSYAILMNPKGSGAVGILPMLIAGDSRLVLDLRFQRYGLPKTITVRRKNDGPLTNVTPASPDPTAAFAAAGDKILADFVPLVVAKSPAPGGAVDAAKRQ